MNIKINRNSQTPIYLQIKGAIINLIAVDEITKGYKLPSERKLAEELAVHRNTVIKAYSELVADGYVAVSRKKPKGYFVKDAREMVTFGQRFFPLEEMIKYNFNDKEKLFLDIFVDSDEGEAISFGGIIMDKEVNPVKGLDDIVRGMTTFDESGNLQSLYRNEADRVKKNICNVLKKENMYVNPKNIQIVSETNQALNCLLTLYLEEGDSIIVEEPIVPDNASIFRNKHLNLLTVPMDEDGMNMQVLETLIVKNRPKFIYTMPNYHNPTGITMSLAKRERLLEIAQNYGIPIIEEDSQRDFRYVNKRLPSLYSLDKYKSVVFIDSFTLTFPYGIKTGYVVGPYDLVEMLRRLIMVDETFVSNMGQYMLNEYIEKGLLEEHVGKLASHYKRKRDLLCLQLDKIKEKGVSYVKPDGGLLIWCTLDSAINEKLLFKKAKEKGILITPGFLFYPNGYQENGHIRLCFSNVSDENIVKGIGLLGEAIDESRVRKLK